MRLRSEVLGFGPPILGIDPGTARIGVCVMMPDGAIRESLTLRADGETLERMALLRGLLHVTFKRLAKDESLMLPTAPVVAIEEGIFAGKRMHVKVAAMLGEIRGIVMAEAWWAGFGIRKISVASWKSYLSVAEKAMAKDSKYVAYWSARLGVQMDSPDAVDAAHIASYAVRGAA